ncbi:hypothetical protein LLEC1_00639 [Akanthomyces lecanii]|uniref:AMP-dependent synthetase/ligase domain-containing protein n=1 Tax=Cordyceps confragosa TaxID=2714763 RepID=A0A179I206_CORDF|nr:hypothetical protein LLEC1_00639 [Akanthomyces lecanii]
MTSRYPLLQCGLSRDDMIAEAVALLCEVDSSRVEDIFPCTPWQQECLTSAADSKENRLSRYEWELQRKVDKLRFQNAVEAVIESTPMLRTRIVQLPGCGLVNVVVRQTLTWTKKTSVEQCIVADDLVISAHHTGAPLSRCGLAEQVEDGVGYFVWALHPAIHDDYSLTLFLSEIEQRYSGLEQASLLPFRLYQEFVQAVDESQAKQFWEAQLRGSKAVAFPIVPSNAPCAQVSKHFQHSTAGPLELGEDDSTAAATISMAWAILAGRSTDSDEVMFGATVTGRQTELTGIERIAGPTTSTVPVRATIDWQSTVAELRHQMHRQTVDMMAFAHFGLQKVRQISDEADKLSHFQSLIVVHPKQDSTAHSGAVFAAQSDGIGAAGFQSSKYAMVITCRMNLQGLDCHMGFDPSIVHDKEAQRMMEQFGHILQLISLPTNAATRLCDLDMASPQDLREIWSWNFAVPAPIHRTVHSLIAETTSRQPDAPAVCAWDGDLTYSELGELSTKLAFCIVDLGVEPGSIIPLCFEKSMWTPVAMLAVMKAGCTAVALDMTHPLLRLRAIVDKYDRKLILCSQTHEALAQALNFSAVFIVDSGHIAQKMTLATELPSVSPSQTVFITYTSGSTGTPKGACISHANVCTASHYQGYRLGFRTTSRVLDFAPYSFDVAWSNVLHTLCAGGCLCVASMEEMMDDIDETLSKFRVNLINITPSALRALTPGQSPLENILLSGERPNSNVLSQWIDKACIKNTYGPAECTFKSTFATISPKNLQNPNIGRPLGVCGWIALPERDHLLAPIGQVGELLIEGPLVGQGYWGEAEKTSAAFIQAPPWLLRGAPGVLGRHGRLYKTGDLMRYNADGTLQFVGRKDAQVKIRGQRVELGEVEHHVQKHLGTTAAENPPFAAEMITPRLNDELAKVLPGYMIPSSYIPIDELPMTGTGKINRRSLREIGSALSREQLLAATM